MLVRAVARILKLTVATDSSKILVFSRRSKRLPDEHLSFVVPRNILIQIIPPDCRASNRSAVSRLFGATTQATWRCTGGIDASGHAASFDVSFYERREMDTIQFDHSQVVTCDQSCWSFCAVGLCTSDSSVRCSCQVLPCTSRLGHNWSKDPKQAHLGNFGSCSYLRICQNYF